MIRTTFACCVIALAPVLAACGSGGEVVKTVTTTATVTNTVTATPEQLPTTDDSSGEVLSGTEETETAATDTVVPPSKKGQTLGLPDFFQPYQEWKESIYDVASSRQIRGIGKEVTSCQPRDENSLQLRLANNFDELTFSVGQANNSQTSSQVLTVEVQGNGKQIGIKKVPFNQQGAIKVDVQNVNALIVQVYQDINVDHCGTEPLTAVISSVLLK